MDCTKCNGSGSEGFISFLRCGRCSGTGKEPADALVPYSDELIVVPSGPVMTAPEEAKADAMKAKKVMEESAEKVKKAVSETLGPTGPREGPRVPTGANGPAGPRPPGHGSYRYAQGYGHQIQGPSCESKPVEEEKINARTFTKYFDLAAQASQSILFRLTEFSEDLYSRYEVRLTEIYFDCNQKYIVKAYHMGVMFLEAFYTGLGIKAETDMKINAIQDVVFDLEAKDPRVPDRIAITLVLEKREEKRIHMPPGDYYPHNGYNPSYGRR